MNDNYLWMSFAGDDDVFLGVIISDELDFVEAVKKSHRLNINPGGQIAGFEIPKSEINESDLWALFSKEELINKDYITDGQCSIGDALNNS
jgi:hypothetical protein